MYAARTYFITFRSVSEKSNCHATNMMQVSSNKELTLLTLGSAHEKFNV